MWHLGACACAVADTWFAASASDLGAVRWLVVLQVLTIGAGIGWMEIYCFFESQPMVLFQPVISLAPMKSPPFFNHSLSILYFYFRPTVIFVVALRCS